MTLDEAIKHCEEVAEEKEQSVDIQGTNQKWVDSCKECAEEHRQLAEWLKELKALREVCTSKAFDMAIEALGQTDTLDKIKAEIEEIEKYYGLDKATKYGNENAEQQRLSYSTMMMYEVADFVDNIKEIIDKYRAEKRGAGCR